MLTQQKIGSLKDVYMYADDVNEKEQEILPVNWESSWKI